MRIQKRVIFTNKLISINAYYDLNNINFVINEK